MDYATRKPWLLASVLANAVLAFLLLWNSFQLSHINLGLSQAFYQQGNLTTTNSTHQDPAAVYAAYPIDFDNATAVFNAVQGAGKQKDSNMAPVGVTFIPAYLPPGTLMYHSTQRTQVPLSYEWIAMDYEFSYSFAHFTRHNRNGHGPGGPGGPPGKGHGPGGPGGPGKGGPFGGGRKTPPSEKTEKRSTEVERPSEGKLAKRMPGGSGPAFLYTFRNTEPLTKLIFLDGASAAKSTTGEMDQQLILSQQRDADARVDERTAAEKICAWGRPFGLQGIVRLEVGYEIVLCNFADRVELVSNTTLHNVTELVGFPDETPNPTGLAAQRSALIDQSSSMSGFDWLRAGANVNDGEARILLDYSAMVTPLNRTWVHPDPYLRRINKVPQALKDEMLAELKAVMVHGGASPYHTTHWPTIIEHIAVKFSPMLILLNTTLAAFAHHHADAAAVQHAVGNITVATYNFVRRYYDDSVADEAQKRSKALDMAVLDYIHHSYPVTTELDILIYSSVYKVTREVLETVFDLFETAKLVLPDVYVTPNADKTDEHTQTLLKKHTLLVRFLDSLRWPIFTRCAKACNWDEACYVPTWGPGPMGFGHARNTPQTYWKDGSYRIGQKLQCVSLKNLR